MTARPDVSRAPLGVITAQALVAAVAEQGDLAERHYLELKSTLDLSTKRDKEKIAKFILGAANRMPDVATAAFEGYGVMVIGVAPGVISGIAPVEHMEISRVIQRYVGAAGPRWDIVWVPVENSTNQVLLVLVDPPRKGQGPFPCRANGEALADGRIYLRADGETREATSEEVDLLVKRGVAIPSVEVNFEIQLVGEVAAVTVDRTKTVDAYVEIVRESLLASLPGNRPMGVTSPASPGSDMAGLSDVPVALGSLNSMAGALAEPEKRTEEDFLKSIDFWEERFRSAWDNAINKIAASQLQPVIVRIINCSRTFYHDVQVKLHLEGDVFAFDYCDPELADDFSDLDLPCPPRKWGPKQRSLNIPDLRNMAHFYAPYPKSYIPPSISYKNGGSVDLNLDIGELRPLVTFESEGEEIVLIVVDQSRASILGTWELTARDHNDVYTGEISIEIAKSHDLTPVARQILQLDGGDGAD